MARQDPFYELKSEIDESVGGARLQQRGVLSRFHVCKLTSCRACSRRLAL